MPTNKNRRAQINRMVRRQARRRKALAAQVMHMRTSHTVIPPKEKPKPVAEGFFDKILYALGETPESISEQIGVSMEDVTEMLGVRAVQLVDIDRDPLWGALANLVETRLAGLMVVRRELQAKLDKDRAARIVREAKAEAL